MNNYLEHHGIKGMKWGIRKNRSSGVKKSKTPKGYDNWSPEAKRTYSLKKKAMNQMSNAELQELTNRQNLEANYRRLNPSTMAKGMAYIGGVSAGMTAIRKLSKNGDYLMKLGSDFLEGYRSARY